ncbi:hypothetical protein C7438_0108 [Brockia lithotrophica]|uniref:DUF3397 domain-containing protein n=2 Tax=Brockia lithotrophica TaxID=933949 RepID=A0A660L573_9BACL|nr:hypothetical protein C7438_0108 [Brockia lithotrophica]
MTNCAQERVFAERGSAVPQVVQHVLAALVVVPPLGFPLVWLVAYYVTRSPSEAREWALGATSLLFFLADFVLGEVVRWGGVGRFAFLFGFFAAFAALVAYGVRRGRRVRFPLGRVALRLGLLYFGGVYALLVLVGILVTAWNL